MLTGAPYSLVAYDGIALPVTTYLYDEVKGATGITPIRVKLIANGIIVTLPEAA